jgi:hypothetical protein
MQDGTKIEKKICKNIVNSNRINQENNIENLNPATQSASLYKILLNFIV